MAPEYKICMNEMKNWSHTQKELSHQSNLYLSQQVAPEFEKWALGNSADHVQNFLARRNIVHHKSASEISEKYREIKPCSENNNFITSKKPTSSYTLFALSGRVMSVKAYAPAILAPEAATPAASKPETKSFR